MFLFQLPIDIDIIKHPQELNSKSTAVHAAVLTTSQVKIYTYPQIPDYSTDRQKVKYPAIGQTEGEVPDYRTD